MPKSEIGIRDEKSRLVSNFAKQEMDLFRFVIFFSSRQAISGLVSFIFKFHMFIRSKVSRLTKEHLAQSGRKFSHFHINAKSQWTRSPMYKKLTVYYPSIGKGYMKELWSQRWTHYFGFVRITHCLVRGRQSSPSRF